MDKKFNKYLIVTLIIFIAAQKIFAQNDTIKYLFYLKDQQSNSFINNVKIKIVDDKNNLKEFKADSILKVDLFIGTKYLFKFYKELYNVKSEYITPIKEYNKFQENVSIYLQKAPVFEEKVPVIFFKKNSSELADSNSYYSLKWFTELLKDNTSLSIEIIGFSGCDEKKSKNASLKRANYIYNHFISNGISADKLRLKKEANFNPYKIADNDIAPMFPMGMVLSESEIQKMPKIRQDIARKLNRRVEFKIIK